MAVLQAALEPSGFAFEIERTPNGTTNAWITHGNGAPLFVFAGHIDVVPAGDPALWTTPPFEPTVRDGKLYARGAADMKGSVAAAAVAFGRLVQEKPDHPGTLAFLITSDEEGDGYEGTKRVVQKLKDEGVTIDACIVGEPSCSRFFGDTIKNGRRGSLNGKVTIRGKAGHVAYPHLARNPIHEAAPFFAELAVKQWDQGNDYFVKFNCPEFTSLCPITGQPDFATVYISYVPDVRMVESKSLKLYLFSFRNHGDFHEDCMNVIMKDLIALMDPKYIEVWGKFLPRGGISIDPYCNYGRPGTRWEEVAWQRLSQHDLYPERVDNR